MSRTYAGCDSAERPGAAEYAMQEIIHRYVRGLRDQNKFCRHIWAFYECLSSPYMVAVGMSSFPAPPAQIRT